jgi:hypothetical protein
MIQADLRHQLTRDDAQLALRLVAHESAAAYETAETALRDQGIDALLDDARLRDALLRDARARRASLPLFVYVVVRHALRDAGEPDRVIADYVASVVVQFASGDRAWRIGAMDDERYDSMVSLLADSGVGDARRAFLIRQHMGNHALWLAGLFPDHVEQRRWRRGGPDLSYYDELGQRGFALAAEHRLSEDTGLRPVFTRAAEEFALLRTALNRVSDALFFPQVHTPERLMRQVRDDGRWTLS